MIRTETKFAAAELCLEKLGDFLLEVAVLVFVFVPIDFWRGTVSVWQITLVLLVSGGAFFIGLACYWVLRNLKKSAG